MPNDSHHSHTQKGFWSDFYGPNFGYIQQLYERFLQDPNAVDEETQRLFAQWGEPVAPEVSKIGVKPPTVAAEFLHKAVAAERLIQAIRMHGHLLANLDPFKMAQHSSLPAVLDPAEYGLSEADLSEIPASVLAEDVPAHIENGWEYMKHLRNIYSGTIAYQFTHCDREEQTWLTRKIERPSTNPSITTEDRFSLLHRLLEVELFERFIHSTFPGQKRFSIEGLDMLVPILDQIVSFGIHNDVEHMMIGMAHRGRLNVLAHVMDRPYEQIFAEFQQSAGKDATAVQSPSKDWPATTGDVAYHMGAIRDVISEDGKKRIQIQLAYNPSHLEFVNSVVLGQTRAAQEERKRKGVSKHDVTKAFAVLIHGDASFPGEGIVQETLNLSGLQGYGTGGTVHIIANNQIGFTTDSSDARTTKYASDLAKAYGIPVIHVNADDPEACLQAALLACEYRKLFHKDILIDLIGYRRFGHNEMDDPEVTQPLLYRQVKQHPTVSKLYADYCKTRGWLTASQLAEMEQKVQAKLRAAYAKLKDPAHMSAWKQPNSQSARPLRSSSHSYVPSAVSSSLLRRLNEELLTWPDSLHPYPKLERILKKRLDAFQANGHVDWAHAEILAFASMLCDGTPVRMSGQDTQRGTFAHRHFILHDVKTGEPYVPLQHLSEAKASFAVYNSPLTEAGVLGFEYGYDVFAREALVLWEAQYGDFANAAQVIIDNFIASGQAKWGQRSKLVMLLPHGYEGQGPEHSNARPERFLELAAEQNWTVVYPTSAAQYFHMLRQQAVWTNEPDGRPLIVMTPKSLLRNPRVASPVGALSQGSFQPVLQRMKHWSAKGKGIDKNVNNVERLILCSGKIAIELETEMESIGQPVERIGLLSVEQFYPFPEEELKSRIQVYPNLNEIVWVQEEPRNMGFWTYMESRLAALVQTDVALRYIGRIDRASPAEGQAADHKAEQRRILTEALTVKEGIGQR